MENNMFEDIVAEGNIVVINNNWIVLCKRWKPWCHNLFCYLYLHKENKNLMVGSHFTMTEDKKKSTRLATNEVPHYWHFFSLDDILATDWEEVEE